MADKKTKTHYERTVLGDELDEEACAVPHGTVDVNGEMVVYVHDEDGNFVEWMKVPEGGFPDSDNPAAKQAEKLAKAKGHKI